jgi:hypothetical protein
MSGRSRFVFLAPRRLLIPSSVVASELVWGPGGQEVGVREALVDPEGDVMPTPREPRPIGLDILA